MQRFNIGKSSEFSDFGDVPSVSCAIILRNNYIGAHDLHRGHIRHIEGERHADRLVRKSEFRGDGFSDALRYRRRSARAAKFVKSVTAVGGRADLAYHAGEKIRDHIRRALRR